MQSVAAILSLAFCLAAAASESLRGVDPAVARRYDVKLGHKFSCFDGSKKVQSKWINDNYCDCPDGSDEPGTLKRICRG